MSASRRKAARQGPKPANTSDRILDAAEMLVQQRGFNGISYADVAGRVGVTKANLHHHFGTKSALGASLLDRYVSRFYRALDLIDASGEAGLAQLEAYAGLYVGVVRDNRLCLCGVLAAEYDTLPAPMRRGVREFFAGNEAWLADVIRRGRADRSLAPRGTNGDEARALLAGLEGAMLITRPRRDYRQFKSLARTLIAGLKGRKRARAA
jgi:TetR/AcrR family transcriptional repressor of nem operon